MLTIEQADEYEAMRDTLTTDQRIELDRYNTMAMYESARDCVND